MMIRQGKNNRQAQSILYLTLLLSTLIFTTGCFSKNERNIINTRSHRMNNDHRPFPDPGSHRPYPYTDRGSYASSSIQFADGLDNNGRFIEDVVENFLNEPVIGQIQDIAIDFHEDSITITVRDQGEGFFRTTLTFVGQMDGAITYQDSEGSVFFEMTQNPDISQVSFENTDGAFGILGHIDTCRVEGSC